MTILILISTSNNNYQKIILLASAIIFTIVWVSSGARGPAIGVLFSLFVMLLWTKNMKLLFLSFIVLAILASQHNPLFERMKNINDINITSPSENKHYSLRERVTYLHFGINTIKKNYLIGLGPHNVEDTMGEFISKLNINAKARDHLHNDFIDIASKFGLPALFLLLLMYFYMYKSSNSNRTVLLLLTLLVLSQITQSQFSHHQAMSFFIFLIYIFINDNIDFIDNESRHKKYIT